MHTWPRPSPTGRSLPQQHVVFRAQSDVDPRSPRDRLDGRHPQAARPARLKQRILHQLFEQGRFGELALLSEYTQLSLRLRSDATLDARVAGHVANRLTRAAARLSRKPLQPAQFRTLQAAVPESVRSTASPAAAQLARSTCRGILFTSGFRRHR